MTNIYNSDDDFVGKHAIFDLELEKNHKYLVAPEHYMESMVKACESVGATVLNTQMHRFGEENLGYTFTIILAESHASCHTWPEYGIATFDIFMCGECDAFEAQERFLEIVKVSGQRIFDTKLFRGYKNNRPPYWRPVKESINE